MKDEHIFTAVAVICGSVVFSVCAKWFLNKIETLPQEERLKNLLDKVGNPYCYLDNGIIVKLNFAPRGSSTLSERVGRCFQFAS